MSKHQNQWGMNFIQKRVDKFKTNFVFQKSSDVAYRNEIIIMFVLMDVVMFWQDNVGIGSDVDVADARVVFNERGVPQARFHRDGGCLRASQLVDDALDLDAFGCLLLAVLKNGKKKDFI